MYTTKRPTVKPWQSCIPKRRSYNMIAIINILCILFNVCSCANQDIELELEPTGVLYVCSGGALKVNCSVTNVDILEWIITIPGLHGSTRTLTRSFAYAGTNTFAVPIILNSTTLNFSRSFPLNSTIFTDNATPDLNETVMTCLGQVFDSGTMSSASVQIILIGNNNHGTVNITPSLNISQRYEANSVTVALGWDAKNGVSYVVSVHPQVPVNYTQKNSALLSVSYGKEYNFSVMASLCGRNRITYTIHRYVRCSHPESSDSDITISDYGNIPIEGTNVTLSCPSDLILSGTYTSTCTRNGNWEPNFEETRCKADCLTPTVNSNVSLDLIHSSTLEDSLLIFWCESGLIPDGVFTARCYRNRSWIPDPSAHVCATLAAANCGDPSPPSDGYLEPYTITLEGARVNIVRECDGQQLIDIMVCNSEEVWELVNGSLCTIIASRGSESTVNSLASIGGSLGSLLAVALLVCGILIVIIVVIARKKGTAVSSSGEQKGGQSKHQNPEYEEVMGSGNEAGHKKPEELEMMQNVAYGPLQLR